MTHCHCSSHYRCAEHEKPIDARVEAVREDVGFFLRRVSARKRFERVLDRLAKE